MIGKLTTRVRGKVEERTLGCELSHPKFGDRQLHPNLRGEKKVNEGGIILLYVKRLANILCQCYCDKFTQL